MRRLLAALVPLAALLVACGDDPKQGTRGSPGAGPGAPAATPDTRPAAPSPAPPPGPEPVPAPAPAPTRVPPASPAPPAPPVAAAIPTRAGDWATWEVRVAGSETVTRVTWRALRVEGERVRFAVESSTKDAAGRQIAVARAEEVRPVDAPRAAAGAAETVEVEGQRLAATTSREGDAEVTRSPQVPFGGLVRLRGTGGAQQTLVGFGRGE